MESGKSRANTIRETKRSELIKYLQSRGLVKHVIDTADKLADLADDLDSIQVQRLKAANDTRLALIKKYLPDVKQTEIVGEDGAPIETNINIRFTPISSK